MSNGNLNETAPTQFQDIGGVSLAHRRFGKDGAPPVVCFQHFTGTINNFDPIHTSRLAQDRPVILVDYRGVGRSGGEMPDSIPATATAADVIAFVKALGLKKIDLFGFSFGGMVAQQVALDAPELVRRILLAGTGPSGGEGMQEYTPEVAGDRQSTQQHSARAHARPILLEEPDEPCGGQGLARADSRAKGGPRTGVEAAGRPGTTGRPCQMGCNPRDGPLRRFEENQAAHTRRQRQERHHGPDHQFLHPSAASAGCSADPLSGFRARRALPVS
jgi:pimeloyl-ACP methyl ester carboxylesterase